MDGRNTGQAGGAQPPEQPAWPAYPPGSPGTGAPGGEPIGLGPNTRCAYHPDRLAGAICRSCNRPICADCMVQAPVGWHCRKCVRENARTSPVIRYRPGRSGAGGARQAPVTMGLISINLALFVAASASARLTYDSYAIPYRMQLSGPDEWYRLFGSFFVTNNLLDVALNMWCLYIVGRMVEPVLGKWRFFALYMLSGLGGSVAYYLLGNLVQPAAGASGAIFGIFGAYFILARRAGANTSSIIGLIAINLVFSFTVPNIAWQAHVGGLVTGLAVAFGFSVARRGRPRQELLADLTVVVLTCLGLGLLMVLPPGVATVG